MIPSHSWNLHSSRGGSHKKWADCGSQPPRWPSMILSSWYSHLPHILPGLVCATNSIWQASRCVTPETGLFKKDCSFCLRCSYTLFWNTLWVGRWSIAMWEAAMSCGEAHLTRNWGLPTTTNEFRSDSRAPVEPWDIYTPSQQIDYNLMKRPCPKPSAKPLRDSWLIETLR